MSGLDNPNHQPPQYSSPIFCTNHHQYSSPMAFPTTNQYPSPVKTTDQKSRIPRIYTNNKSAFYILSACIHCSSISLGWWCQLLEREEGQDENQLSCLLITKSYRKNPHIFCVCQCQLFEREGREPAAPSPYQILHTQRNIL